MVDVKAIHYTNIKAEKLTFGNSLDALPALWYHRSNH